MIWLRAAVVSFALVGTSHAEVLTSPRPSERGIEAAEIAVRTSEDSPSSAAPGRSGRPALRPARVAPVIEIPASESRSQRPLVRPSERPPVSVKPQRQRNELAVKPAQQQRQRSGLFGIFGGKRVARGAEGSVCNDSSIEGMAIRPIPAGLPGCGLRNGVRITKVDGVFLSTPANVDCNTARALKSWVRNGVKPAIGKRGDGVAVLKVAAHYACRTRNNRRGARISEHGKGRAIDISAIQLKNGETITVLDGWRDPRDGKALREMQQAACGPFGTVLGPNADRYHRDHFHFDTARYRTGPYCR
ncbi:MAG: extensin family protein [Pseudomonadota bacterium]